MTLVKGVSTATRSADEPTATYVAPPARPPAILIRQLTKRYGDVVALDALDLSVPDGSVFGFLGPNGAGKTTTLRLLTGLSRPSSGTAIVAGIPVDGGGLELTRHIGYLGQEPRFYGWMTGRELLELAGRAYGMRGPSLRTRVDEVLEVIGLADAGRRRISTYSGGMRQRVGIGQAILPSPSVLFLDEPVSALDPAGRRDVLELIGSLRDSTTILMSTHILNDIERICDRVAIVDRGHLVTEAPIAELLSRHARPILELDPEPGQDGTTMARLEATMRSAAWANDVRVEHGVVRVSVSDAGQAHREALSMLASARVGVMRFEWVRPTLEDVFLELVENGTTQEAHPATRGADAGAWPVEGSPT
jgi:ABC-2 type transport system ATP-binding protein